METPGPEGEGRRNDEGSRSVSFLGGRPSIDPSYEFNAPQFHDFVNARDDPIAAESYFEKDGRRMTLLQGGSAPASQGKESSPAISQPALDAVRGPPPPSPGLRAPSYSVLAPEQLAAAIAVPDSSKSASSDVPGFMRPRVPATARNNAPGKQADKLKPAMARSKNAIQKSASTTTVASGERPRFQQSRNIRRPSPKTSEELELEKLAEEMRAAAALRERNKTRMLAGLSGAPPVQPSSHSKKHLTVPRPFEFRSSSAHRSKTTFSQSFSTDTKDATRSRSKSKSSTRSFDGSRSVSRSSSLHSTRSEPTSKSDYEPLSVATQKFFANRSAGHAPSTPSVACRKPPNEFHFSTPRAKPSTLSTEEKQLKEIKTYSAFKARKVPRSVLNSTGDVGVPRVRKKSATVAKEFSLSSSKRPSSVPPQTSEKEEFHQFKARPVPVSVLNGPSQTHTSKRSHSLTVPISPMLTKPKSKPSVASPAEEPPVEFHARPMPDFSRPASSSVSHIRHVTVAEPFALKTEERGAKKRAQFMAQAKAQEEAEESARTYKARPLVFTSPMKVQQSDASLTEPKPFRLRSQKFSEKMLTSFRKKMQEELDKENEQFSAFRASVPLHRIKEPFVPEPPQHEPVVPEPFHLATAERAVKREQFDHAVEQAHREAEAARKQREAEEQKRRDEELAASLDAMAFKAKPFRPPRPFSTRKSMIPLTEPMSPQFATESRIGRSTKTK
ncbi:unnamed protein product (mitochondrion) [Plasmodiophora brassicae]|uniref:TPX2 C-terminal domain-containing protein n=1 Tax=Plasmodiophora brassicae TaxID=37360 RepID=A0A0G4IQQ6_PLABS|nr:hypothetical protein PBRA_005787 [Plasmodiophora brassicae]SPQ98219.1 unnamed protein product [Plasmodiophora brassicae]